MNDTVFSYMLRTAVALETISGTNGDEETDSYNGLLKRIVDAMEGGVVGPGSLSNRLVIAAANYTGN